MAKIETSYKSEKCKPTTKQNTNHISITLQNFFKNLTTQNVTIGELKEALADRTLTVLMIIFTLPNLIPLPIPGISTILGVPLIFLSFQLMIGRKTPWFPKWLSERSIKRSKIERTILYILPYIKKLELILKPRLKFFVEPFITHIIAALCFIMALTITLPIPLGNFFPALSICLFSLARLERDGLLVLIGLITSLISITLVLLVAFTSLRGIQYSLENFFN